MFLVGHRRLDSTRVKHLTSACLALSAAGFCACSSGSGTDGGSGTPGTAVQVSVAPSNQEQSVQIPQQSGPITGSLGFLPISAPTSNGGNLTLTVQSGANVASESTGPTAGLGFLEQQRTTAASENVNLFTGKLSAPFDFVTSAPGLNIDLNSLGLPGSVPYVFSVEGTPGGPTFEYPVVAENGVITFAGDSTPNGLLAISPTQVFLMTLIQGNGIPGGITVTPRTATISVEQTQDFTAAVNGVCPSGGVVWSVNGGSAGGTFVSTGPCTITYTAPNVPGQYGLFATEASDSSNQAGATINVTSG